MVSLGFDELVNEVDGPDLRYEDLLEMVKQIKQLNIKTLFVLEGGYLMESLYHGTAKLLEGLCSD